MTTIGPRSTGAFPGYLTGSGSALLLVAEPAAFYRPRHPERHCFYKVFEQHFDAYCFAYEERFEPRDGPLRSVVASTVEAYLACGRPEGHSDVESTPVQQGNVLEAVCAGANVQPASAYYVLRAVNPCTGATGP